MEQKGKRRWHQCVSRTTRVRSLPRGLARGGRAASCLSARRLRAYSCLSCLPTSRTKCSSVTSVVSLATTVLARAMTVTEGSSALLNSPPWMMLSAAVIACKAHRPSLGSTGKSTFPTTRRAVRPLQPSASAARSLSRPSPNATVFRWSPRGLWPPRRPCTDATILAMRRHLIIITLRYRPRRPAMVRRMRRPRRAATARRPPPTR